MGSLEHMNMLVRGRSLDRQSPELSGRSTPNSPNRDYLHKYHTVSGLIPNQGELWGVFKSGEQIVKDIDSTQLLMMMMTGSRIDVTGTFAAVRDVSQSRSPALRVPTVEPGDCPNKTQYVQSSCSLPQNKHKHKETRYTLQRPPTPHLLHRPLLLLWCLFSFARSL